MINFPLTIDSKRLWQRDENSFEIRDLLEKDYQTASNGELKGISLFLVDKDYVMRADLITQEMYGFLDPIEKFLKFNGISNPFSINEGDVYTMFDLPSAEENMRSAQNTQAAREDIRNQYITPEKRSTVDPRYQDYSKRSAAPKPDPSKGNAPALPPNLANFGDEEIQIRNGKMVLGPNVTKTGGQEDQPFSKSELIAKIIKNRIKNQ